MAVSSYFQEEVTAVDATKTLTWTSGASGYTEFEYSYNGLDVQGGSDYAVELGLSELLQAMGFAWYGPNAATQYKRPVSIPTGLVQAKTSPWMPYSVCQLHWGNSTFSAGYATNLDASDAVINNAISKWTILNNFNREIFPAGHWWTTIITENQAYFDGYAAANGGTSLLLNPTTFDLDAITPSGTPTHWANLVNISAAQVLETGLNAYNRANFDPPDGNPHNADQVFRFAKAVADVVRAGTPAIGTHPIRTGVPTAQLGVYAYNNHSDTPAATASPGVYVQAATAYNQPGESFEDKLQAMGSKFDAMFLREYLDIYSWCENAPFNNSRVKNTYFDRYLNYQQYGVIGSKWEWTPNILWNIIQIRWMARLMKTGNYTYDEAVADYVNDCCGGDAKVTELYEELGSPYEVYHKWNIKKLFGIVDAMQTGTYKTHYKYLCCIAYEQLTLPDQTGTDAPGNAFYDAFTKWAAHVIAVREDMIIGSYAFMRQRCRTQLGTFTSRKWDQNPAPDWMTSPYYPDDTDFTTYKAALDADAARPADMDSTDLVLMKVTPNNSSGDHDLFYSKNAATYTFIGPGYVTISADDITDSESGEVIPGETSTDYYPAGPNVIQLFGQLTVEHSGGYLFQNCFPNLGQPTPTGVPDRYAFFPTRHDNAYEIDIPEIAYRVAIHDGVASRSFYNPSDASYTVDPDVCAPGQNRIVSTLTEGFYTFLNINKYASLKASIALVPRAIAEEEKPNRTVITRN